MHKAGAELTMRKRVGSLLRRVFGESLIPSRRDLEFIAEWPILRLAAAFVPERAWFGIAMRVVQAKILLGLRDPAVNAENIRSGLNLNETAAARDISSRHLAGRIEHFIQVLKSSGGGWNPGIQIEGRAHLDAAVAQGKGTIQRQAATR
jgi:hypothetical protein